MRLWSGTAWVPDNLRTLLRWGAGLRGFGRRRARRNFGPLKILGKGFRAHTGQERTRARAVVERALELV